ncbi:MAG: DnaJ domain-containing protein [Bdellovibrionaceae bacterium]|nr:DnaJ domain-containing protein [Pseudobdellovibrionaceae bacterium]
MPKKYKILVLDDDAVFADSVSKSLQDYGYDSMACTSTFDAEDKLQTFCPDLLIVDLFMPSGNGADWVSALLQKGSLAIPVIYMSGVFTDLEFQASLLYHPLILKVFSKPFAIADLFLVIEQHQKNKISETKQKAKVSELSCLEQALIGSNYTDSQFIQNLKRPMKCVANNLPEHLTSFFHIKANGFLKIRKEDEEIVIHYKEGNIVFVKMQDNNTLGALLAKITQLKYEDIEMHCLEAQNTKQNIGSFLLKNSLITEIEIFKAVNLQIALRLLTLFDDQPVSCEWVDEEKPDFALVGHFSIEEWQRVLIRVSNNLTEKCLNTFFKRFKSYYVILREEQLPVSIANKELLNHFSQLKAELSSTCVQLEKLELMNTEEGLKSVYLFLLLNVLALSDVKQLSKKELLTITNANKNKDYFELLNLDAKATEQNIKQAYRHLSKKFHPDNAAFFSSEEERGLYEEIFNSISEAYSTLSKEEMRVSYQSVLEQEQFENQFKQQLIEDEIIEQLKSCDLTNLLEKINNSYIIYAKKQVFLLWALVIAYTQEGSVEKRKVIKKKMKVYLKNVPDTITNFNHIIYLSKALCYEVLHNLEEAKYYFSKVESVASINIQDNLKNIKMLLLDRKKKNVRKRDWQLGLLVFALLVGVFSYKISKDDINLLVVDIESPASSPKVTKKKKRGLSSVDKKIQIASYFSNLEGFYLDSLEEAKGYKLVSLKNYQLISKEEKVNKLNILIYKQIALRKGPVTEKNFLKKQNKKQIKGINNFLESQISIEKISPTVWSGYTGGPQKKSLLVQYVKQHNTFLYFIGESENILQLKDNIEKSLSRL